MARYIDVEALGIGKADRNAFEIPQYADGWNSAIEIIANAPTADVVPKSEVAREIFEEMQSCLMIRHWHGNDILTFEFDAVKYAELKKKYTEEKE